MNDIHDQTSIEQKVQAAYQSLQPDSAFAARLRGQVAARVSRADQRRPRQFSWFSWRTAVAGALVLALAFIFSSGSSSALAQAVRQMFGYLPGVGIVDRSAPLRVVAEPVSQTREGVTLTVEQVFAGPQLTVVQFAVAGIPASAFPQHRAGSDRQGFQKPCVEALYLRLPDGTTLQNAGFNAISGHIGVPEYQTSFTVAPVPGDIDRAVLVMPCILGTELGTIPENWELPVRFVAAPDDLEMAPVSELEGAVSSQPAPDPTLLPASAASDPAKPGSNDITIVLEKQVALPDGYLLYGNLLWGENTPYSAVTPDTYELTDAKGQRIPMTSASPDPSWVPQPGLRRVPLGFEVIGPIQNPGPVTLTVDSVDAWLPVEGARFRFDTGPDPRVGQQWILDQDIDAAGYTIHLDSVTRTPDGYDFAYQTDTDVLSVDLVIEDRNPVGGEVGSAYTRLAYDGEIPSGDLLVTIANLFARLTGRWQVTWTP